MLEFLCAWCTDRFTRYNPDGAEHYFAEGYYRGWLDLKTGQEGRPDRLDTYDVPQCYRGDYARGYQDGFADGVENVDEDDARLLENVYDIPDF
jgi:hypothetical protein